MDTISCGATIAWAMNCFEQGILGLKDTGGIELRFGNAEAMVRMTKMIGERQGLGNLLAEGSARAAQQIGNGAEDLVVAVKKQEMPAHMPQVKRSLALIYAVNPFGADHQSSEHDPAWKSDRDRLAEIGFTLEPQPNKVLSEEKVRFALTTQHSYSCLDSVNVCQFVFGPAWHLYGMKQLAEAVRLITGWEVSVEELQRVGERRLNMLRAFNAREDRSRGRCTAQEDQQGLGGRQVGWTVSDRGRSRAGQGLVLRPVWLGCRHRETHPGEAGATRFGLGGGRVGAVEGAARCALLYWGERESSAR